MANIGPKKKISKTQKHSRKSTWTTLTLKKMSNRMAIAACKNCGAAKMAYRVCGACGYYADTQILTIKTKQKETVMEA
jgi:large subunit ribosomal protein L32